MTEHLEHGPSCRDTFASNLLTNFTDAAQAAELASSADADFATQQLPAVDEWMRRRAAVQSVNASRRRQRLAIRLGRARAAQQLVNALRAGRFGIGNKVFPIPKRGELSRGILPASTGSDNPFS
jgi:hypothetical protein